MSESPQSEQQARWIVAYNGDGGGDDGEDNGDCVLEGKHNTHSLPVGMLGHRDVDIDDGTVQEEANLQSPLHLDAHRPACHSTDGVAVADGGYEVDGLYCPKKHCGGGNR
mmetsp:Transcript_26715/g.47086  ORF Transcript_26715/g.47086 Transcript_26715/m.47086 type:complete len:110 (-) Transcript_26715:281-610(-)